MKPVTKTLCNFNGMAKGMAQVEKRRDGFTKARKVKFCETLLERGPYFYDVCHINSINYRTYKNHYDLDAAFQWQVKTAIARWEDHQLREIEAVSMRLAKKESPSTTDVW